MPERKLAVQGVRRGLPEREAVNFLDGLGELRRVKQHAFDLFGVAFQAFVGAESCARGTPKLTTDSFFLRRRQTRRLFGRANDDFPAGATRVCPADIRRPSEFQNWRLGDVVAVLVHPGQGIIAFRSAEINQPRPAAFCRQRQKRLVE